MSTRTSWKTTTKEGRGALVAMFAVVIAGFLATGIGSIDYYGTPEGISLTEWTAMIILGIILLIVYYRDATDQSPRSTADIIRTYAIILPLLFAIAYLAKGHSQMWLLTFPAVGHVVEYLFGWQRILGYIALPASCFIPLMLRYDIQSLSPLLVSLVPAYLFVIAFTKLQVQADKARESAENLATDLAQANTQLADYATQAEDLATTKERNRLAREIHDNLGHYLTIVNVQLEAAKLMVTKNPEKAQESIEKAQRLTKEGLQSVRQSVSALREDAVANRPIPEAIAQLIEDSRTRGLETNYTVTGDPRDLEAKTKLTLYRAAQEGLTNIRKHASASKIDLVLDYTNLSSVRLTLEDDGLGSAEPDGGFGLVGMRERVHLLGGAMTVRTAPQQGFKLAVVIPG